MELSARLSTAMGKKKMRKKNLSVWETTVLGCFTPSQPVRLYQSDWKTTKQNKKRVGIFRRRKQIGSLLEPDHPRDAEVLENRNIGARKKKKSLLLQRKRLAFGRFIGAANGEKRFSTCNKARNDAAENCFMHVIVL